MKTMSFIQKSCLCFLIILGISLSIHAEGCIGEFCSSAVVKPSCTEKVCNTGFLGIGMFYNSAKGSDVGVSSSNLGGYIFTEGQLLLWQRLQLGVLLRLGLGQQKVSGDSLTYLAQDNYAFYFDGLARLGYNVATPNVPLFINFTGGYDIYVGDVDRYLYVIGAELQGSIPLGKSYRIMYTLGYNWNVFGMYGVRNVGIRMRPERVYAAFYTASLGFMAQVSDNLVFYLRAVGKYYDLPTFYRVEAIPNDTLIDYPSKDTFTAMIEFGFKIR